MAGVLVQQLVEHHLERLVCQPTVLHGLHPAPGLDAPDKELQLVPRRRYPRLIDHLGMTMPVTLVGVVQQGLRVVVVRGVLVVLLAGRLNHAENLVEC